MTEYFLGVDIGGTKSHALIADEDGLAVGFGSGGAGNHEVVGYEGLRATLNEITQKALVSAGLRRAQISGAGFGVAGYDWPSELPPTLDAIATLGLDAPLMAVNDTVIGLLAGAEAGWGVALVSGTSNNCWGWDRERRIGRVMGNGFVFGENAGASEMMVKAVQAVAKAWTRRGPATALTNLFVAQAGAKNIADLLEGLSQDFYGLTSRSAPLVFEVARQGDEVAIEVIRWAGQELASLATGVIRQLHFEALSFEVVLVGSMYDGGPLLLEPLQEAVWASAPGARFVRLTAPPVIGAVLLGMEQGGLAAQAVRQPLIDSTQAMLAG